MYCFLPTEVEGFAPLAELGLGHALVLESLRRRGVAAARSRPLGTHAKPLGSAADGLAGQAPADLGRPCFRTKVDALVQAAVRQRRRPAWFQQTYPQSSLTCVAYFSMEFMLSEALPIYSGGLGNVAGDQLKAASDLGVPVVAVGLLYQQGYFRQVIDKDGAQQALFPYNDPGQLPITPLRQPNGEWLRLEIDLPGYSVWLRAWQVQVAG